MASVWCGELALLILLGSDKRLGLELLYSDFQVQQTKCIIILVIRAEMGLLLGNWNQPHPAVHVDIQAFFPSPTQLSHSVCNNRA
uniref:Small molecule transporter n=1 Tax=Solanum tuberosum TaxID=4113 RepID=M1CP19_SOLTU